MSETGGKGETSAKRIEVDNPEKIRENQLKFAAKVWMTLPTKVREHMAGWLAIVYRVQICKVIRDNGHCRCVICEKDGETGGERGKA